MLDDNLSLNLEKIYLCPSKDGCPCGSEISSPGKSFLNQFFFGIISFSLIVFLKNNIFELHLVIFLS